MRRPRKPRRLIHGFGNDLIPLNERHPGDILRRSVAHSLDLTNLSDTNRIVIGLTECQHFDASVTGDLDFVSRPVLPVVDVRD